MRPHCAPRGNPGVAAFLANLETEVLRLERQLHAGLYCPGRYTKIGIRDPKHRMVSAAPFRDRVVHHASCGRIGFVLFPGGRRRLPEENVRRFRNRLRGLRDRWRHGTVSKDEVRRRIQSWIAHAEHADTWRLRHAIFRGGWFDLSRGV